MPNTQVSSLVHCDFSCKGRCQRIASEIQPQLWAFLGGIARNGFQALVVGETVNHAHSFVATRNHAGGESRTTVEGHLFQIDGPKTHRRFSVAGGLRGIYRRQKPGTVANIQAQAQHHQKRNFKDEFLTFQRKHGIEYDPKYA